MKIRSITVTAGRTVQHPLESYANLRPEIVLHADLDEGEDPDAAVRALQGKAESLVEAHTNDLKQFLRDEESRRERTREISTLRDRLDRDKQRLTDLLDAEKRDAADPTVQMLQERVQETSREIDALEAR